MRIKWTRGANTHSHKQTYTQTHTHTHTHPHTPTHTNTHTYTYSCVWVWVSVWVWVWVWVCGVCTEAMPCIFDYIFCIIHVIYIHVHTYEYEYEYIYNMHSLSHKCTHTHKHTHTHTHTHTHACIHICGSFVKNGTSITYVPRTTETASEAQNKNFSKLFVKLYHSILTEFFLLYFFRRKLITTPN
jgi:hypothetical protein